MYTCTNPNQNFDKRKFYLFIFRIYFLCVILKSQCRPLAVSFLNNMMRVEVVCTCTAEDIIV